MEILSDSSDSDSHIVQSVRTLPKLQLPYQSSICTPPEIRQKTIKVQYVENRGSMCGYSNSNDFIYGSAKTSTIGNDNCIYYYRAIVLRDDEVIMTENDTFILFKLNNMMVESIKYVNGANKSELYISFGPNWGITRINSRWDEVIFQFNENISYINHMARSFPTYVNVEYYKQYHNFLELDNFELIPSFNRIANNMKYRELYKTALCIKNNLPAKKIENVHCIICMHEPPVYALDCGHLLYCEACHVQTSRIKRQRVEYLCPMCKTTHQTLLRIYY